jgi:hypothetical protein
MAAINAPRREAVGLVNARRTIAGFDKENLIIIEAFYKVLLIDSRNENKIHLIS